MDSLTVIQNFEAGLKGSGGNYFTDGNSLFLFGNMIAKHTENGIMFSLAGWNSQTTKKTLSRLSGVCVHTKKGILYNNDQEINDHDWYPVLQSEILEEAE